MSWWNSPRVWRLPNQSLAAVKLEVGNCKTRVWQLPNQSLATTKPVRRHRRRRMRRRMMGMMRKMGRRRRMRRNRRRTDGEANESVRNQTTPPWRLRNNQTNKQTNKRSNSHNTYFINYVDYRLWIELVMECEHMSWTIPWAADNANSNGQYVHCSRWAAPEHDPTQTVRDMSLRQGHARPRSGAWEPRHAIPFRTI